MADVCDTLTALREQSPLVHNLTNLVAMDLTANLLLAAGASPVMAHAREELREVVEAAGAVSINIGTLSLSWIETMIQTAQLAKDTNTPWVLDPVGAGATGYRTESALRLAELHPAVIRANAAEVAALAGAADGQAPRGVDSTMDSVEALDAAAELAQRYGTVVAVTGSVDYVTDGIRLVAVANGVPMMSRITAMGCALSALVAACTAIAPGRIEAAAHASAILGVAGEQAARLADGPGSLRWRLLDALDSMETEDLRMMASIEG